MQPLYYIITWAVACKFDLCRREQATTGTKSTCCLAFTIHVYDWLTEYIEWMLRLGTTCTLSFLLLPSTFLDFRKGAANDIATRRTAFLQVRSLFPFIVFVFRLLTKKVHLALWLWSYDVTLLLRHWISCPYVVRNKWRNSSDPQSVTWNYKVSHVRVFSIWRPDGNPRFLAGKAQGQCPRVIQAYLFLHSNGCDLICWTSDYTVVLISSSVAGILWFEFWRIIANRTKETQLQSYDCWYWLCDP